MNCQFVVLILTVKKDNFYIYLVNYWGGCDAYGKRAPSITNLTIHCVALEAISHRDNDVWWCSYYGTLRNPFFVL